MPDLNFAIEGAEAIPYAATPLIVLKLRVTNGNSDESLHSVSVQCQIQIQASRRRYNDEEQRRLRDLFGSTDRWSQTLRTMLWTHANVTVPAFSGTILVDVPVPCTFDFNVAATKYFSANEIGEIPILVQFSGTVFYAGEDGALQVSPIPWSREAAYNLPVAVWKEMMEMYYPNTAWLSLRRDVFDRLLEYKSQRGIPTWEQTFESMLTS